MTIWITVATAAIIMAAAQVALTALTSAVFRGANIYKLLVAVSFLTAPLVFLSDSLLLGAPQPVEGRLFLVLLHLALGGLFFHFMTLPDRSVTLRILVELHLAPTGALSLADLNARFSIRDMIGSRLQQLADGRFLTIDAKGALTLLPRGEKFGRFVVRGRNLFRIVSAN